MIVYHGSNHNFRKLKISKDLVQSEATMLNEGMGIYFSTDKNVAMSYGKFLYTLEINDNKFIDFRQIRNCKIYVIKLAQLVYQSSGLDILKYIDAELIIQRLYSGDQCIATLDREIYLLLDSNEQWYREFATKREKAMNILRSEHKKLLNVYMFNYNIPNIGIIKKIDDSIVKIVSREKV